ncbi:MAG: tetratricopeptide repeat protein [Saprospiraceae bacterium]|nr:tetratricopeptide repeat protein [Saprospiraceae bacterium]
MFRFFFLLMFTMINVSTFAQKSATYDEPLSMFKRGQYYYDLGIYGASLRELQILQNQTSPPNTTKFSEQQKNVELMIAESAVRLELIESEKIMLDFIRNSSPDPIASQAVSTMGDYYFDKKEYDKALSFFNEVDKGSLTQAQRTEITFKEGYANFVKKNFSQAKYSFKQIKDQQTVYFYPTNYYLGMIAFFEAKYDEAIKQFKICEASKKYKSQIPYLVCQIYFAKKQYTELVEYANPRLKDGDIAKKTEIKQLVGQSYFELGEYENASTYLEEVANSVRMRPQDYYQLGFVQYKAKKYKDAITNLTQSSNAENIIGQSSLFFLGDCNIKIKNKSDARVAFGTASRMNYDKIIQEEATINYAKLSYELGFDAEASNTLSKIKSDSKYYDEAQELMSDVLVSSRDYEKALTIMEGLPNKSTKLKETYQKVACYQGMQYIKDGDLQKAENSLRLSLQDPIDRPTKSQANYWLAEIANRQKNYSKSNDLLNTFFASYKTADGLPEESSSITANYLQGYNYLKLKNYDKAITAFNECAKAIKSNERDIQSDYIKSDIKGDLMLRLGDCYFKKNKYDDASKMYNEAIAKKYKGFVYAIYQKAIIEGLKGQSLDKIVTLEGLIESYPKSEFTDDALLQLGSTYLEMDKLNEATKPLKKLVTDYKTKSPNINKALLKLGITYYNLGNYNASLDYYKQIFGNNPQPSETKEAMDGIEEIYLKELNKPEEYTAFLENVGGKVVSESSKDSINYKAAVKQFENGNYENAITGYTSYINKYPNGRSTLEAYYNRAECQVLLKNYDDALKDYDYVVKRGSSNFYAKATEKAAIISYNYDKNFAKSYDYYTKWEQVALSDENKLEAQLGAMRSAFRNGDKQSTSEWATKVSSNSKATVDQQLQAQFHIGEIALDKKKYDEALTAYNKVTKLKKESEYLSEAKYKIAYIYYLKRDFEIAEDLAMKVSQEASGKDKIWAGKAVVLVGDINAEKGDLINARAAYEVVIENFDDIPEVKKDAEQKLSKLKSNLQNTDKNSMKVDGSELEMDENGNN